MNIEFKNLSKIIKDFPVDEKLEVRVNESKEELVLRLRNSDYLHNGRKFIFEGIEEVTEVIFGDMKYSNLSYVSSETYIHNVKVDSNFVMVEDFTVTFSR